MEIKFKAWDGKHFYYDVIVGKNCAILQCNIDSEDGSDFEPIYYTTQLDKSTFKVVQFIGVKDSKGEEIYDGDILLYGEDKYRVWIEEGKILIGGLNKEWDEFLNSYKVSKMTIIGNILSNPELLIEK